MKQILDNGLIAVSVTCQETKPFSGLIHSISRLSESVLLELAARSYAGISLPIWRYSVETTPRQKPNSITLSQSREWVDGSWVMGQMGHENRMGHMGHGSLGVDP